MSQEDVYTATLRGASAQTLYALSAKHDVSPLIIIYRALHLLKLWDELEQHKKLAVYNEKTGSIELVEFKYRKGLDDAFSQIVHPSITRRFIRFFRGH